VAPVAFQGRRTYHLNPRQPRHLCFHREHASHRSHEAKNGLQPLFAVDDVVDHVSTVVTAVQKNGWNWESSQQTLDQELAIFVAPHGLPLKGWRQIQALLLVSTNQVVDGERFMLNIK
jgi:hypothetical protein